MTNTQIETKNGKLSAYGFACGYREFKENLTIYKELYQGHGVFHVRSTYNNSPELSTKFDGSTSHSYIIWESFYKLTDARKFYNSIL